MIQIGSFLVFFTIYVLKSINFAFLKKWLEMLYSGQVKTFVWRRVTQENQKLRAT